MIFSMVGDLDAIGSSHKCHHNCGNPSGKRRKDNGIFEDAIYQDAIEFLTKIDDKW